MIVDANVTTYIHSLEQGNAPFLEELRKRAEEGDVPVIRREMESFIRTLLRMNRPEKILEIGTATGFSAIFMATYSEASITTIENYAPRIAKARENIEACGLGDRISLIEGDATEVIKNIYGEFDFIFLDAAKGQYITLLPDILRVLRTGGVLLADNVLQEGDIVRSRYSQPRRQRTIHERIRDFLWEVKHNEQLETAVLSIGDGVTLSVKK